ncbi:beta-glucosidase [Amycolatopsis mediterranei S699]|uniref:Beta-glucosidase n=2 Tax=Amycolatopsis mediterranei TaxID=33910 RepID=A0A0H3DI81_AMYMU|nr:GH1 family beta-glucosidase [Amycolatopsis mediterranei]ADJ49823.1 beta-glucosidase [Amycolatopsis mediterranei U32]AEK46811.1 beta-glucosidase [Amycolatopsis mediterranei S699]AFO81530.1 beta-glucosidase [Amycolatopsis mediterranei S699]AGT88659.1 beta-glucosidase [Amycolatopsis mediterranei RB]KDO07927.1 beta-glucosidase [Amycolatopsis mediterranei]
MTFPKGFLWGAATASYQVEGGVTEGGRGPSIWDTFAAADGKVLGGATGAVACDHYHRYPEDIGLLADLGLNAYRFSVAWPRVMPDGRTTSAAGLAFYDRLVDELLSRDVVPVLTLYHWDLPQALEDAGGWPERDTASRFADYAAVVHAALGDRVNQWTTVNEPFCAAFLGYGSGVHAPGVQDYDTALVAAHHLLLGHGLAARALAGQARPGHEFSLALNFAPAIPDGSSPAHAEAARKFDGIHNRFFLDPVLGRGYPEDVLADVEHHGGRFAAAVRDGDTDVIAAPIDWLGVNYYAPARVTPLADPLSASNCPLPGLRGMDVLPAEGPLTAFGWEQSPSTLTSLLDWLSSQSGLPLVVAENGASFVDHVVDGRVFDAARVNYFMDHLGAVHDAIRDGVDVRGYFAWSLLDNFEWAMGYTQRFGLVHVDFETQRRTVKESGRFLGRVAKANALVTPAEGVGDARA